MNQEKQLQAIRERWSGARWEDYGGRGLFDEVWMGEVTA